MAQSQAKPAAANAWTPGPWTAARYAYGGYGLFQVQPFADRQRKRFLREDESVGTLEESLANARLIASAPDLYEALWSLLTAVEYTRVLKGPKGEAIRGKANAALRKALGEEQSL